MPHGDGALAVHVLPRYVLHNTLDVALQYKQQGAGGERELPPAAPRAVQWPNATLPLRLCLRVQASRWRQPANKVCNHYGIALHSHWTASPAYVPLQHETRLWKRTSAPPPTGEWLMCATWLLLGRRRRAGSGPAALRWTRQATSSSRSGTGPLPDHITCTEAPRQACSDIPWTLTEP